MRVVVPHTIYRSEALHLAPRPAGLRGKVIGFLDGWGRREEDGTFRMYPLMEELKDLLEQRCGVASAVWLKKPSISKPAPKEQIAELVAEADVVINGEAA
ncbi:MAG: hypothetical protein ACE5FK_04665 [Candidatus Methylomirabilia bacterium]